ncbi:hypothetical protein Smp_174790 [Schistosoma mansoni]|uniref:hypothetical protein n=1 Tax=Schistosoma mansoni TaxID=6183 RepID=UPI0001A6215D|nr:hypothetical protein Smp_174790 [Schistosoma mansoni]|eukprot:XP_018650875.1 hypothetical protein Smp_174790 [Schistosoma mansoni]
MYDAARINYLKNGETVRMKKYYVYGDRIIDYLKCDQMIISYSEKTASSNKRNLLYKK